LVLELSNPAADGGDRHFKTPRRLGEAPGFDDLREQRQRVEIRHRLSETDYERQNRVALARIAVNLVERGAPPTFGKLIFDFAD
jgi:hypothetical protein